MKKKERREEKGDEKREREKGNTIYASDESSNRIEKSSRRSSPRSQSHSKQTCIHAYIHIRTQVEKHGKTRRRFLESNAREFIIFPMIRVIRADSLWVARFFREMKLVNEILSAIIRFSRVARYRVAMPETKRAPPAPLLLSSSLLFLAVRKIALFVFPCIGWVLYKHK